jgi:hypothetical protein
MRIDRVADRQNRRGGQQGSAIILAVVALGVLSALGIGLALVTSGDRQAARFQRDHQDALYAAEAGLAVAKRDIQDRNLTFDDEDADGRPDFRILDTLDWGGSYEVFGESSELTAGGLSPYSGDSFTLQARGEARGAVRELEAEIQHDSFLKYARFIALTGTSYACDAILTGEVYSGANLDCPAGCPSGSEAEFLEFVAAVGQVVNADDNIFHKGYSDSAPPIDLNASVDWADIRDRARGVAAECDCDGIGRVGIYMGYNPLGIGTNGTINFSLFDFNFTYPWAPTDTLISYAGVVVRDTTTGSDLRKRDFNGMIFYEGDATVRGTLDGVSGISLTIWGTDDLIIDGNILTGNTGFDPVTRLPNGAGDPVNIGLIASDYVYVGNTPRVLQVDAALMAVNNNWRCLNSAEAAHPAAAPGNYDLDCDGIVGESPVNNDPDDGTGWDEVITAANAANTWVLNINGPIITANGGSAAPWSNAGVIAVSTGPTRRYNYDLDISDFPPPCFPVPMNLWKDRAWTEVFE